MSLDYHDVDIAVRAALIGDATLSALTGTRIYSRVPMSQLTFPFVRMTQTADDFQGATMSAPVARVWNVGYQFNCFSQLQTNDECSAALKALCDVMEADNDAGSLAAEFSLRSMNLVGVTPRVRAPDFDSGRLTWVGVAEFKLMIMEA